MDVYIASDLVLSKIARHNVVEQSVKLYPEVKYKGYNDFL